MAKHKTLGQVFTPNWIIAEILNFIKNKHYSDWSVIENVLKSDDFYKYIRLTGKDFSGGYKSITSKQINQNYA